jgi:signal peptidase I
MAASKSNRPQASRKKPASSAEPKPERTLGRSAWEWTKSLFIGFLLFLVIRTFVIQTWTVISGSMEDTLLVGDFLVLSKSAYGATIPGTDVTLPGYSHPTRGDIVVFRGHHEPIDLVKRLVGVPGDTLAMRDGVLYVNGDPLDESYAVHTDPSTDSYHPSMDWQRSYLLHPDDANRYRPTRDNWGPVVVPPESFFVMGDNRDQSLDSRYWGFVPRDSIKGRAVMLYFSWDRNALGALPLIGHVRWGRVGDRIH